MRTTLPDNLKILVADKDEFFRRSLQRALKDRFYSVWVAESGNQILQLCERIPFDLAVIDDPLPGILGVEVIRRLEKRWPGMKKILVSEFDMDRVIESALDYGILDRFLQKPLDVRDLLWEIEFLLGLVAETSPRIHEDEPGNESEWNESPLRERQLSLGLSKAH